MKSVGIIILILGIGIGFFLREALRARPAAAKLVTIRSRNLEFQVATRAATIGEVLGEQGFLVSTPSYSPPYHGGENNVLFGFSPSQREGGEEEGVRNGMTIEIVKPVNITLSDGGNEQNLTTTAATVGDLLFEQKLGLAATDQVKPPLESYLADNLKVVIDRIVDLEVTEIHEIAYEIKLQYDPESYYGREEVITPGAVGRKEQQFLITYKNGVETKRRLLKSTVLERAVTELRKFGSKIEIEEAREGRASWYAYKKCLCAAHPFYELGRYVRVTALSTGKSLIVQVNDRGPEVDKHPERIIDLDSAAFKELEPLGTGTIAVRVELLQN